MARFDAGFYSRYRPLYPPALFDGLVAALEASGFGPPFSVADVGCGTGQSIASVIDAGVSARITGVDPDPRMLEAAREFLGPRAEVNLAEGRGEATGLPGESYELVLVGSAFHWMSEPEAREELLRILKPGGLLLVFEYQFPKCPSLPELNEWIRREFNLRWKAPKQFPRGDFASVTRGLREDTRLELRSDRRIPMRLELDAERLQGLILSQSRVLHYEETLKADAAIQAFREGLLKRLTGWLGNEGQADFDFALTCAGFKKSPNPKSVGDQG